MAKSKKRKPQGHPSRTQPKMRSKITASTAEGLLGAFMADWRDHQLKRVEVLNRLIANNPTVEGREIAKEYAHVAALALIQVVDILSDAEETIIDLMKKGDL